MQNNNSASESARLWYLDFLRIFATFTVVLLHATPLTALKVSFTSAEWRIMNVVSSLCRWNVPVFFMISGVLFLSEKRAFSTQRLYKKTIARMLASFCIWSAVYALAYCLVNDKGLWAFLNQLFRGHYHLWYLFTIISLYWITPLLRRITESKKATEYLLCAGFVFSFLIPRALGFVLLFEHPHTDVLLSLNTAYSQLNPYKSLYFVYYYVLGHYLHTYPLGKSARRLLYLFGAAGCILTPVLADWYANYCGSARSHFYDLASLNVLAMAAAVFVLFKSAFERFTAEGRAKTVILHLSGRSFGVYLVHALILEQLSPTLQVSPAGLLLGIPLVSLAVYALSYLISTVLSHIPILNKYAV